MYSPQISKEPVHVYDEIDDSVRELNKTSQKAEVKNLKIKKESEPEKYDRYQSDIEIQKKKLESSKQQQASASALQDPEAPELPNREYLTDIDFVAQEFDLLLRCAPELPNRTEDSTNTMSLMSTDVTTDDKAIDSEWVKNTTKKHSHGTQQFLLQQELERSVGMTPKSALPRKHNIIKGSNSKAVSGSSQSHKQREKMARNFPGEIKAARDPGSGFKHCASSSCEPQLLLVQKQRGMKPLPYRQPIRAEQVLQPVSGSQNMDTSPMYQNVTEEEPTYDDTVTVNYLNVTGDVQQKEMTYQNILSKKRQHIREEAATYQPLIFHSASADTEEDEYMEMDNMM